MNLATDIAGDHAIVDNTTTVTLTPENTSVDPTTGITALKRALSRRDWMYAADAGYTPDSTVWHLWNTTIDPKQGDIITDTASQEWIVVSAEFQTLASRWRCVCNKK